MSDSVLHAAAGAAGGVVAMSLTYPLIFLSTRAAVETRKENKSTYEAVMDIINSEGLRGLYAGLHSSLLGIAVTNCVYYGFYEQTKKSIVSSTSRKSASQGLTTLESMLAGLIAGTATTVISNPIWVVQTTQAVRTMPASSAAMRSEPVPRALIKKAGMVETVRSIVKKDGIAAFWRGLGPALVLVMNPILQYTLFEQLKNFIVKRRTARLRASGSPLAAALSDVDYFFLGALSKLIATSVTYPYIVVKSRMQSGHAQGREYKSALDGLLTVVHREGISGLYKGVGNKLIQSVLTAAILFAGQRRIYELTKSALAPVVKK